MKKVKIVVDRKKFVQQVAGALCCIIVYGMIFYLMAMAL